MKRNLEVIQVFRRVADVLHHASDEIEALPASSPARGRFRREGFRVLAILGDASYSIYLMHLIVFLLFHTARQRLGALQQLPFDLYFLFLSATAVAAGIAFHFAAEKPLLHLSRRLIEPREKLPAAA